MPKQKDQQRMEPIQLTVVPPGEGKTLNVLGQRHCVKITGAETEGAFSVTEAEMPPQSYVPLHIHTREEESFYILEGVLEVQCGKRTISATKGSLIVLPRNVPHGYRNPGNGSTRVLVMTTPAGFEGFFEEAGKLPADQPPDPQKLAAIGRRYGLEFVPPPVQG